MRSVVNETIYLVPGGAVYYSRNEYPFYSEKYPYIIKLNNSTTNSKCGLKFTACFLKSSLLMWYLINKIDNTDLFIPEVFRKLRFPAINMRDPTSIAIIQDIENSLDNIQNLEKTFLINLSREKKDSIDAYKILVDNHNKKVAEISYAIDMHIYKIFGFSDDAINIVEDNLRLNNIFLPKIKSH
jgi:hypothetical protein